MQRAKQNNAIERKQQTWKHEQKKERQTKEKCKENECSCSES